MHSGSTHGLEAGGPVFFSPQFLNRVNNGLLLSHSDSNAFGFGLVDFDQTMPTLALPAIRFALHIDGHGDSLR